MMFCPKCGFKMKNVMHFEKDNSYKYNQCSKCHYVSNKKSKINFSTLTSQNNILR